MDLSMMLSNLRSLQSSINMINLKRAMNQDASNALTLINDMTASTPHIIDSVAGKLDIRI